MSRVHGRVETLLSEIEDRLGQLEEALQTADARLQNQTLTRIRHISERARRTGDDRLRTQSLRVYHRILASQALSETGGIPVVPGEPGASHVVLVMLKALFGAGWLQGKTVDEVAELLVWFGELWKTDTLEA